MRYIVSRIIYLYWIFYFTDD